MPFQLNAGDRKILTAAGVVFIILTVAAALLVTPESRRDTTPTTYSVNSYGAKAAWLLLREMGYSAERHELSPAEIDDFRNTTLIIAEPSIYPAKEEREAIERFIRQGGRIIAAGPSAAAMLPDNDIQRADAVADTVFDAPPEWEDFSALAPSDITLAAPEITLSPRAFWPSHGSALALYGTEDKPVAVRYFYGEGTVIWWAAATPLTNAGLKESGNLEFFIACLEGKENRILWDEYFHGHRRSERNTLEARMFLGLLIQSALLGLTVIWTFSRRSGPLRPQFHESRLSPLEFVETLGNLYHRARAASVAVDICYRRFVYLLTRRLGMPPDAPPEQIEQAARKRWEFADAELSTALKECAAARQRHDLPPGQALGLVRSLYTYAGKMKIFPVSHMGASKNSKIKACD
ncbi:MAG: DUF4350 domain-containing protein [Acidobacteriota bacterium]|jgi:hypothetical protein|nr:DUF4350 domain-containing protein [Acidobacteriota bacterium]